MARIRSVKPEICTSETMAELSAELERTFVRLWTHCDDEGRCRDNTRLIKAAIYPLHDDITADVLDDQLDLLVSAGLVTRYVVDGIAVVAVTHFAEHQRPQKKQASKLPPPIESGNSTQSTRDETTTVPLRDDDDSPTVDRRDGYGPVVVEGDVVVEGENTPSSAESKPLVLAAPDSSPSATVSDRWERFWSTYPKKVGKQAARKAWDRARKRRPAEQIQAALDAHLPAWSTMDVQFIPNPATWLGQGRYEDPPPKPRAGSVRSSKASAAMATIAASVERMEAHR